MLILSRNIGEALHIGDDTVTAVHGHQVRFGIDAPREVVVDRSEIASRKQHERAPSLNAENPTITTALAARSAWPNIRVTKRRISRERVLESADPSTWAPAPGRRKQPTLHIGPSKSKITSL
jgi:carbon storage regulator